MRAEFSSNAIEPLRFFIEFIQNDEILNFENKFYNYPINPSQIPNRDEGFIEYQKDFLIDDEEGRVIEYFSVKLKRLLETQANISYNYLYKRKKEKEYEGIFENQFLELQISEIGNLREKSDNLPHASILLEILDVLQFKMKSLMYQDKLIKRNIQKPKKTTSPFFENKKKTTIHRLKKLFENILEIDLIDEEEVSEETFIEVFTSVNPIKHNKAIHFKANNYKAHYFLRELSAHFENLKPAQIAKSESFYSKGNTLFNQKSIDKYYSELKNRDDSEFIQIKEAIDKSMYKNP